MQKDNDIKNKFIVDESFKSDQLNQLAGRLLNWAKVTKKGEIIIHNDGSLSPDDKLRIALVARYIGHYLSGEIPESIKLVELKAIINETTQATGSRISKLEKKDKFARKVKYGTYAVRPHKIEEFITKLESRFNK